MLVIKNANLYSPEPQGTKDILMAAGHVLAIEDTISDQYLLPGTEVIDAKHNYVVPGFVDSLVHITGGGGEGGFNTRTPQMNLSDATSAGITTVIGALGTDATTRSLEDLLAKARALTIEGISCYCHTGSYQIPVRTITGNVRDDIILIPDFIGVGEIAIADHRSSVPQMPELARIASEARVGGMLSGKKGIVSIHVGDSTEYLQLLEEIVKYSDIPRSQFYPTHINRNIGLLNAGKHWAKDGGYIDLTTSTTEMDLQNGEPSCSEALAELLKSGVPVSQITFSSDGHASLPVFNDKAELVGLQVGKEDSLFNEVKKAVQEEGVALENALQVITSSPAAVLGLKRKGQVSLAHDADLVILDKDSLAINSVIAKSRVMIAEGEIIVRGTFE